MLAALYPYLLTRSDLRAKAYAQGRTNVRPSVETPLLPASNCFHCLPGGRECYDMCEFAGDRYMGSSRCNTCYSPDVPEDVTCCVVDASRKREGLNGCIGSLGATAAAKCIRLIQSSAVLGCGNKAWVWGG